MTAVAAAAAAMVVGGGGEGRKDRFASNVSGNQKKGKGDVKMKRVVGGGGARGVGCVWLGGRGCVFSKCEFTCGVSHCILAFLMWWWRWWLLL